MNIDVEALFKGEAFTALGPERLRLFKQFARDIDGKKIPEIAALYMKLNQALTKERPLSTAERSAIISAITNSLPDADRGKFAQMLRMLNVK